MSPDYLFVLSTVAPVVMVVAAGLILRQSGLFSGQSDRALIRLNINILYPALILHSVWGCDALSHGGNIVWGPLLGIVTTLAGFIIAWQIARLAGLTSGNGKRTFAIATGVFNYGFIPIPIITFVLRDTGLLGVLFAFTLGVEVAIWTVGIIIMSGAHWKEIGKKLLNPPLLSILLGIVMNRTGIDDAVPTFIHRFTEMMGACAVPIALLLSGSVVAEAMREIEPARILGPSLGAVATRSLLMPPIFLALAVLLPISSEMRTILVIEAGMPAAMMPIVLARHYGGHPPTAAVVMLSTTAVGLFLIPAWISLGMQLVCP